MKKTIDPAHEIGENLTITDRSQLLSITPEQAKKIKSLRIEDQVIDGYFISDFFQWSLFLKNINSLYFFKCSFDRYGTGILGGVDSVANIGFVNCGLSAPDVRYIFPPMASWFPIKVIDLSGNRIGEDSGHFVTFLRHDIWETIHVDNLILSGNGISEEDQCEILKACATIKNVTF